MQNDVVAIDFFFDREIMRKEWGIVKENTVKNILLEKENDRYWIIDKKAFKTFFNNSTVPASVILPAPSIFDRMKGIFNLAP